MGSFVLATTTHLLHFASMLKLLLVAAQISLPILILSVSFHFCSLHPFPSGDSLFVAKRDGLASNILQRIHAPTALSLPENAFFRTLALKESKYLSFRNGCGTVPFFHRSNRPWAAFLHVHFPKCWIGSTKNQKFQNVKENHKFALPTKGGKEVAPSAENDLLNKETNTFRDSPWPTTDSHPPTLDPKLVATDRFTSKIDIAAATMPIGKPIVLQDTDMRIPREAFPIPPDVFILNFGGTIQWNIREILFTAARAADKIWPHLPLLYRSSESRKQSVPFWLLERLKHARPLLRSYHDIIIALRYFVEEIHKIENFLGFSITDYSVKQSHLRERQQQHYSKSYEVLYDILESYHECTVKDMKKDQRGYLMFPWLVKKFENWNSNPKFKNYLYDRYNITKDGRALEQSFYKAREEWQLEDYNSWCNAALYRTECSHLSSMDKVHHRGYNVAAIGAINHNLQIYGTPMYIYSTTETEETIRTLLKLFGVNYNVTTEPLIKIYGVDTLIPTSEISDSGNFPLDRTSAVLWHIKKDFHATKNQVPIHLVDDDINCLKYISEQPQFEDVRLYFAEWGFSSYSDKEAAHMCDRIKVFRSSHRLVSLCCLPADIWGRQWTHGYTSKQPLWDSDRYVHQWASAHGWYQ